jgi:cytochrome c556
LANAGQCRSQPLPAPATEDIMLKSIVLGAALTLAALPALAEDSRTRLNLPPDVREQFLEEMRNHMAALDGVMQLLGAGRPREAGALARKEMAMGHGRGFGRYMPIEFRELGMAYHRSAEEFARLTETLPEKPSAEQWVQLMGGLGAVTANCAGCHGAFRAW